MTSSSRAERERAFYRAAAAELDPERMPPRTPHRYDLAVIERLGDVAGRRVLEVGCGDGEVTLELARRGAEVTALDLAPELLAVARARMERFRPEARPTFVCAPLEDTGLEAGAYELVAGKWILHHTDLRRSAPEVARLLRPGGRAVFFENQSLNPLLRFARERLLDLPGVVRVGTRDERPLDESDFDYLAEVFDSVELTYPSFYFFEALGRQVLRYRGHRYLQAADELVRRRLPRARRWSYHVLLELRKGGGSPNDEIRDGW